MSGATRRGRPSFPLAAALCLLGFAPGCAGRFRTHTEFLAVGFTQGSLRGRTVALVPDSLLPDAADAGTLAGVSRGIRAAGARVLVLDPSERLPADAGAADRLNASAAPQHPQRVSYLDVTPAPPAANYLLVVRVTAADVYRRFAAGPDGVGARTTGRRVALRLELLRLPSRDPLWVARGSGDLWNTRSAPSALAGSLEDDLRAGNLLLYPQPPDARSVAEGLTRRLLAQVPSPPELEPN